MICRWYLTGPRRLPASHGRACRRRPLRNGRGSASASELSPAAPGVGARGSRALVTASAWQRVTARRAALDDMVRVSIARSQARQVRTRTDPSRGGRCRSQRQGRVRRFPCSTLRHTPTRAHLSTPRRLLPLQQDAAAGPGPVTHVRPVISRHTMVRPRCCSLSAIPI